MRGQLRDAKIAYAIETRSKQRVEPKPAPWAGFFDFFRSLLGEPAPPRRQRTRLGRQMRRRGSLERKARQRQHEKACDERFRRLQLQAAAERGDIHPRHKR